jgi:hypothetical protein
VTLGTEQPETTLYFTLSPKLDQALAQGWRAWDAETDRAGADRVAAWLIHRQGDEADAEGIRESVAPLFSAEDDEAKIIAKADLAELLEETDPEVSDMLWEGLLEIGYERDDPDLIFEATVHSATLAEAHGQFQIAAEYFINFLNWRRQPGHSSDPESVEDALAEAARLAEADGARREAAIFQYRLAQFVPLVEAGDDRAAEGDWEPDTTPYEPW